LQARWKREWELQKQRAEEARRRAELERARIEFLAGQLDTFDEKSQLERFLKGLTSSSLKKMAAPMRTFARWAEERLEQLAWACSAEGLDSLLFSGAAANPVAGDSNLDLS
jgi:hypothetical protein